MSRLQLNYIRIPVQDRHGPDDDTVNAFVTFVKTLPEDVWLHFHCLAGEGRTTTFMVIYDILRNAPLVPYATSPDGYPKQSWTQWRSLHV